MATPQGNFIAYQPLKPVEYKVGDLYSKYIDELIKDNKAKEAAAAKMMQQQKKEIGASFDKIPANPFVTDSRLQNMANDMFRKTADYIAEQRMLAENDHKNRYAYLARAEKAARDYSTISTSFGSKDFMDRANAKITALSNGETFLDSDNNDKLKMISVGMVDYRLDPESGQIQFALPKNNYATHDDPVQWISTGEVLNLFTNPDEIDFLKNNKANGNNGFMDTTIPSVAKTMQDEWSSNTDGNRTNSWAKFAEERAVKWFNSTFGDYNANAIDPILRQYSKRHFKKEIESEEDYKKVKKGIIDNIASYVPTENETKTRLTAAELDDIKAGAKQKKAQTAKIKKDMQDYEVTITSGYSFAKDGNGGKFERSGTEMAVRDKKGNNVFIQAVYQRNKNGKGGNITYYAGGIDETGGVTYDTPISTTEAHSLIKSVGKSVSMIEAEVKRGGFTKKRKISSSSRNTGIINYTPKGSFGPSSTADIEGSIYDKKDGF